MEHHTKVSVRHPENLTDLVGREVLHLPQDKGQALSERRRVEACEDLAPDLLILQVDVHRQGWRAPLACGVEAALEDLVNVIHLSVPIARAPRLGDLVVEDAEEPRPDAGPSLKTRRGLDKSRERGLRDVLRLLGIEARTARGAEDLGEVGLDDGLDGGALASPDLRREVRILRYRGRRL
jgi:hypothetical protein